TRLLLRFNRIASIIVNANYSVMSAAVELCVVDGVGSCAWLAVPQATEWQRIGSQIDAAMISAPADFVNIRWLRRMLGVARLRSPDWTDSEVIYQRCKRGFYRCLVAVADLIAVMHRSIALFMDSPIRVSSSEAAARRATKPRWKSMNQFGCGSGSGIGGHHGGSFSRRFGRVGHQSSRSSETRPRSSPKRSASQAVRINSAASAAPNSLGGGSGGSGCGLSATSKKRLNGPRGITSYMAGQRRPIIARSRESRASVGFMIMFAVFFWLFLFFVFFTASCGKVF